MPIVMIEKDYHLQAKDGVMLFAHSWEPTQTILGVLTMVHGFGEHCLRYTPYFKNFTDAGFAILAFDLRGHGQSAGKRGVIPSYEALMADIEVIVSKTSVLFSDIPHFIYGHSMGGNLALNYLLRRQPKLRGAIISSPWLALTKDPHPILKRLVKILQYILPDNTINSGLDTNYISTIKDEVLKYNTDPLNHGRISFRLFDAITTSGKWAVENIDKLNIPTLLLHGNADQITSPLASKKIALKNPSQITFMEWTLGYHELHNDTCSLDVANKSIEWLKNLV